MLFGSSCIYPKNLKKPMKENKMMTGILEKTNESYSIAKIAGIKMIESFNKQYNTKNVQNKKFISFDHESVDFML